MADTAAAHTAESQESLPDWLLASPPACAAGEAPLSASATQPLASPDVTSATPAAAAADVSVLLVSDGGEALPPSAKRSRRAAGGSATPATPGIPPFSLDVRPRRGAAAAAVVALSHAPASQASAASSVSSATGAGGAGSAAASLASCIVTMGAATGAGGGDSVRVVIGAEWLRLPPSSAASPAPAGRWGHSATLLWSVDGSDDASGDGGGAGRAQLLVFGGEDAIDAPLGDAWLFDLGPRTWTPAGTSATTPRKWHTAVGSSGGRAIVVYGGGAEPTAAASATPATAPIEGDADTSIAVLDTALMCWYSPAVAGKAPAPRSGHCVFAVCEDDAGADPSVMVVFGGTRGRGHLADTHALNIRTFRWQPVRTCGRVPQPRAYASGVAVGSRLVCFGGNSGSLSFNDVHVLDVRGGLAGAAEGDGWRWEAPEVSGVPPCPRTGSAAAVVGRRFVVIVGGWDPDATDAAASAGAAGATPGSGRAPGGSVSTATAAKARGVGDGGADGSSGRKRKRGAISGGAGECGSGDGVTTPWSASQRLDAAAAAELAAEDAVRSAAPQGPYADVHVLDTRTWEWLRVAVVAVGIDGAGSGDDSAAAVADAVVPPRVGLAAVGLDDVGSALGDARLIGRPGVVVVGGQARDGSRHADVACLLLPAAFAAAAGGDDGTDA